MKSINGGQNWVNLTPNISGDFTAISFLNSLTGYCIGFGNPNSVMMKTTNGGVNWNSQYLSMISRRGGSIVIVDSNVVYACGYEGVSKTTNGGVNWFSTNAPGTILQNIYFFDAFTGFAVGYYYRIYKTTNGGTAWQLKSGSGITAPYINSLSFFGRTTGIAVGDDGKLLKTTNSGENWQDIAVPTDKELTSVCLTDSNTIHFGGGYESCIYKTTTGGSPIGMSNAGISMPSSFTLSQNYPNPFNPQTKIKIDVPKTALTKLIVYDILGREVATLVNEELKPGTYSFDWDGSNYASGIYFYRLIADDYTETKKMVLMK
jgi:hypothetical protein